MGFYQTYANSNSEFHSKIDDEERLREELKDLIDDAPIEEESDAESDGSGGSTKRKKRDDDDDYDDRLEDEDYDLIEENLGVKVERRVSFMHACCHINTVVLLTHLY